MAIFRFYMGESIKNRLENNSMILNTVSQELFEIVRSTPDNIFFFGIFNEAVRLDKIEFLVWEKQEFEELTDRYGQPWYYLLIATYSHVNKKPMGAEIQGYFADMIVNDETGEVSIRPIEDLYSPII